MNSNRLSYNAMRVLQICFILVAVLSASLSLGQEFKRQYKTAKGLYDDKQYNLAMEAFKPLMVYDKENSYTEVATFYYALSAFQQKYLAVAKESLIQLKNLYPDWDQRDEVNYWLAVIYFQQGETFQGLRMLYDMKSPRDLASIERLKNYHLLQLYDDEVIRLVLEEFPGETTLMRRWIIRKIAKGDYQKARELIVQYGLEEKDFDFPEQRKDIKKDTYRVAALFPFLSETLEPTPGAKRNQSALDLYLGMKLGADSLKALGMNIELVAYDTKRDPATIQSLLSLEEMKSSDVLVGPLFTDELPMVSQFSKANQIPMVNPVSNSPDFVKENPFALLYQPDFAAIGVASAEALAKKKLDKPCVVLYGEQPRDSIMAFAFVKRAEELNIKVVLTREITKANSAAVYTTLANPTKFDKFRNPIEFTIKRDSIGSVFVASDDELIFTKVISSVDRRADGVAIIGLDSWIDKPSMDFDKFERLHILMSSPQYTNPFGDEYLAFRRSYAKAYGTLPSTFSKTGFECMMFLGQALKSYGIDFVNQIKQNSINLGALGRVLRYQDSQCNREVPMATFELGELRMQY